jgi:sensor c-di-GMP phosphodiesterase-like protein
MTMRLSRARRSWPFYWATLGVFLGSLVPTVVLLTISYYQAVHRTQVWLKTNLDTATQRTDNLLESAETILTRISADTAGRVSPETFKLIRRYVYNDPRFREAGIIDEQGFLVLSSLGPLNAPIPILPKHRADPHQPSLQVIGPVKTSVMKEESIVLSLPVPKRGEVNLIVDPVVLTYFLDDIELGTNGFIAFVGGDGRILTGVGALRRDRKPLSMNPSNTGIRVRQSTQNGDVTVVGEVPTEWALRYWKQDVITGGLLTLLCSGFLIVLFLKFMQRVSGIEQDIRIGLKNREFEVHYQPIIDLQTNQCVGSEALVRWQHPDLGSILPGVFIPIAEKTGLIQLLSEWIIHQVIQDQADLLAQFPNAYVSINLSPSLLASEAFLTWVVQTLTQSALPVQQVIFEVTENGLIDRLHASNMTKLRRLGAWFALDDFGTGYSSLSYLDKFQFEYLKIDRCFIQRIQADGTTSPICDTVIELGQKLGLQLVAEGVETEEQCQYLRQAGVRYVQGWLFAKAMPLLKFKQFLQN